MKNFNIEMREKYSDIFDNWIGDYIEADSDIIAIELAKQWLIDHGMDQDSVNELEYNVKPAYSAKEAA